MSRRSKKHLSCGSKKHPFRWLKRRVFRWFKASLYRKLILSHVGILLFLFVLGIIIGSIAYRIHIQDMIQKRFESQTHIIFHQMKKEFNVLRQTSPGTTLLPKVSKKTIPPTSLPTAGSKERCPPQERPQQRGLQLLATLCQRIQESSVVLSALVSVENPDGSCLMEANPAHFQMYWPGSIKKLPMSCQRLLTPLAQSPLSSKARYSAHKKATILKTKHSCKLLQRRMRHWRKRHRVVARYTYSITPPERYRVTYVSIPSLHRPGPLPALWIAFLILLVVGVGLLTIPISRSITRPLLELIKAVRQIQSGDVTQKVTIRSHDEVGELASVVDEMRSSLLRHRLQRRALIADISHEIRTPLSRIRVVGESVADGLMREPEKLTQVMEGICNQVDEIDQLLGDLFDLAKMEQSDPSQLTYQNIQIDQLLKEMKRTLEPAAQTVKKHLELGPIPEVLPPIRADLRRLRQVLNNLIQNAIRYSPEDSTITLSAQEEDGWIYCEVCDQGSGVPEAERGKIFERLYRTDSSRSRLTGGHGLGLAIVKQIITAHHGEVGVIDAPGGGACFWFKLPITTEKEN